MLTIQVVVGRQTGRVLLCTECNCCYLFNIYNRQLTGIRKNPIVDVFIDSILVMILQVIVEFYHLMGMFKMWSSALSLLFETTYFVTKIAAILDLSNMPSTRFRCW